MRQWELRASGIPVGYHSTRAAYSLRAGWCRRVYELSQ